ncbi:family 43 glycosylhydrolase [Mucilaginibacter angelicae]|uniref:Family 43 glycosylhydrolase n=1 Tax=Mucilaginibacter angelicae TaxID=869718 RepID=A0ABV6LF50_9SPHI
MPNGNYLLKFTILCLGLITSMRVSAQKLTKISPGEVWPDDKGEHIQAHGGGITRVKDTYYWYGEERRQGLDSNKRYVSCYASNDLMNWKFKGDVVQMTDPENLGRHWILERPKVFYSKKSRQYVMYFHLDNAGYKFARVGLAISEKPDGKFRYLKSFRPLGHESRDIGQFTDDDGAQYLIFEDRPLGFHIVKLTEDCLGIDREMCLIPEHMEGGAIVHYKGLYYAIGSALTGWRPNPNQYATAKSLEGPWSEFKDIAPKETNTYGSQSTLLLKVTGRKDTTIMFLGDIWKPKTQWDSRYLWMPVEIGDGKLWLPQPEPFKIDVKSGTAVKAPQ